VTAPLTLAVTAGCNVVEMLGGEDDEGVPVLVDERGGTYGGVGLGSSEAEVRAVFGDPGEGEGFIPLDEEAFVAVSPPTSIYASSTLATSSNVAAPASAL
jgi:hypothetical protein